MVKQDSEDMGTVMVQGLFWKVKDAENPYDIDCVRGCETMKRKKKPKAVRLALGMVLLLLAWAGGPCMETVLAAGGVVSFGPESYAWNIGEVNALEISFGSDTAVSSYSICLEYDSAILEYLDGADRTEGKRLWLEGGGGEEGYVRTLLFRPRSRGNTQVRLVSASGSSEAVDGETVTEEEILVDRLPKVSISVQEAGSRLSSLEVGFAEGMEAFSPEILEYHMQVGYEVDWLPMEYEMEDEEAEVTVSGMELETGRNTVTLEVRRGQAEPVVYTLYVERAERPEGIAEAGGTERQDAETGDTGAGLSSGSGSMDGGNSEDENTGDGNTEDGKTGDAEEAAITGETGGNGTSFVPEGSFWKRKKDLWGVAAAVLCMAALYLIFWLKRRKEAERLKRQEDDAIKVINLDKTVIDVRHVTMNFKLAQDESSSLKEYLIRTLKRQNHYRVFSALKDISFEVKQGEVMGIIGTNGSGKSTLLKIIAGALIPTKGKVVVNTSKIHMLTLGTGFDMELTARENVYLNGAIIGYTKEYIDEKFDDIVAFAELDGFMDERMKNFSSGMVSRLGFAIATMRESPDILILDEVLSVGDMFFRKKSEERIQEMIHSGATVLIVSHSADFIRKNCDTAVWIEKGVMKMMGKPEDVCKAYGQMEK